MNFRNWMEAEKTPEPWEMTRDEAMAHRTELFRRHHDLCQKHGGYPACSSVPEVVASRKAIEDWPDADFHKYEVSMAIAQGKPVRDEVIKSIFWKKGELEKLYTKKRLANPQKLGDLPDYSGMFD